VSQQWRIKFYRQANGTEPVKEFLVSSVLTPAELKQIQARLKRLQEIGVTLMVERADILEKIEDNLYSLRLANTQNNPRIFLCVLKERHEIYLLHAFKKKDRKIPKRHIDIGIRRRDFIVSGGRNDDSE
jgi:phage-related protein